MSYSKQQQLDYLPLRSQGTSTTVRLLNGTAAIGVTSSPMPILNLSLGSLNVFVFTVTFVSTSVNWVLIDVSVLRLTPSSLSSSEFVNYVMVSRALKRDQMYTPGNILCQLGTGAKTSESVARGCWPAEQYMNICVVLPFKFEIWI